MPPPDESPKSLIERCHFSLHQDFLACYQAACLFFSRPNPMGRSGQYSYTSQKPRPCILSPKSQRLNDWVLGHLGKPKSHGLHGSGRTSQAYSTLLACLWTFGSNPTMQLLILTILHDLRILDYHNSRGSRLCRSCRIKSTGNCHLKLRSIEQRRMEILR